MFFSSVWLRYVVIGYDGSHSGYFGLTVVEWRERDIFIYTVNILLIYYLCAELMKSFVDL